MRVEVFKAWQRIHSSFWFVPAIMTGGAMLMAFTVVALDARITDWLALNWGLSFTGGAEGASSLLAAIAGSMITIAGVVFSITLVALSLASSQLGPRLLRSFMSDTPTQMVLGTFVATFLYCLLVLRTIRRAEEVAFVPHLAVTIGVLLAVVSVWLLIYFIHHVSVSIQANEIVARVGNELIAGLDKLFPEYIGQASKQGSAELAGSDFLDRFEREARPVESASDGYLQFVDGGALMTLAIQEGVVIRLLRRPGDYVVATRPLVLVWPGNRISDPLVERVRSVVALGKQRTSGQDIEFSVNQLVEIAVRALSPGVNDPFTAMACVDHLGSALCRLSQREMPSPYRYDGQGRLRVIAPVFSFPDVVGAALNQIRQNGRSSAAVTIRLLETIGVIAESVHRSEDRAALLRQAEMIARGGRDGLPEEEDRRQVERCFRLSKKILSAEDFGR